MEQDIGHINFFNINFLAPTQNARFWAPRRKQKKEFMCLISWERTAKKGKGRQKGTHINFFAFFFGCQKGGPKRAIFGHKRLIAVVVFLARKQWPNDIPRNRGETKG